MHECANGKKKVETLFKLKFNENAAQILFFCFACLHGFYFHFSLFSFLHETLFMVSIRQHSNSIPFSTNLSVCLFTYAPLRIYGFGLVADPKAESFRWRALSQSTKSLFALNDQASHMPWVGDGGVGEGDVVAAASYGLEYTTLPGKWGETWLQGVGDCTPRLPVGARSQHEYL